MAFIKQRPEASVGPHGVYERRDDLQALLDETRAVTADGELRIVEVRGEAGIGKTRFLQELAASLSSSDDGRTYVGIGRATATSTLTSPFQPFRGAVEDLLRRSAPRGRGPLRAALESVKSNFPEIVASAPVIGQAAKATVLVAGGYRAERRGEDSSTPDLARQFLSFFAGLAAEAPLVVMLDDMQWGDQSSVDLLFETAEGLARLPVTLVVAYRPDDLERAAGSHPLSITLERLRRYRKVSGTLSLARLGREGVRQMVGDILGHEPTEHLAAWLLDKSNGNPFFAEEFIALLSDKNVIEVADNRSFVAPSALARLQALPPTVAAVVGERLALIGRNSMEYRALQVAAIVGNPFEVDAIAEVGEMHLAVAAEALRQACQRFGLIRPVPDGDGYVFFHGLVDEYLENELRESDVHDFRRLHLNAGGRLRHEPDAAPIDARRAIAFHYHAAEAHALAAPACLEAAEDALTMSALNEALGAAKWSAIHAEAITDAKSRLRALLLQGSVLQQLRNVHEAVEVLEDAASSADDDGGVSDEHRSALMLELAKAYRMERRWDDARRSLKRADQTVPSQSSELRAAIGLLTGEVDLCGQPRRLEHALHALEAATHQVRQQRTRGSVLGHLALVRLALDDIEGCERALSDAQHSADESLNPASLFETALWEAHVSLACVELERAGAAVRRMAHLASEHGIGDTDVHRYRGRVRALAGAHEEAAEAYGRFLAADLSLAALVPSARSWVLTHVELQTAELLALRGEPEAAAFLLALSVFVRDGELGSDASELSLYLEALTSALNRGVQLGLPTTDLARPYALDQAAASAFYFYMDDLAHFRTRHGFQR